jgi:hypothetical protein
MQMSNENLQSQVKWGSLFKHTLPFVPFGLYLLTSIGLLPIEIMPVVLVITVAVLLVWGLWKVWRGAINKDGRELANGVSPLAFAVLTLLQERGFLDSNLFSYLVIFSIGVSWIIEKLLLKVWERKE